MVWHWDDDDRALGVVDAGGADRTENRSRQATPPPAPDNEHFGSARGLYKSVGGTQLDQSPFYRHRAVGDQGQLLIQEVAGDAFGLGDRYPDIGVRVRRAVVPSVNNDATDVVQGCFFESPPQGSTTVL
jgi:hypothetical protein